MRGTRRVPPQYRRDVRIIPAHAGTRLFLFNPERFDRIIPAHAGNSTLTLSIAKDSPDHPRACGELGIIW